MAIIKTYFLWAPLLVAGFNAFAADPGTDLRESRKALIRQVVKRVERDHYDAKPLNDTYSLSVWNKFLKALDRQGLIFLKEDSISLAKYQFAIDDQLHNSSLEFYEIVYDLYRKRVKEIRGLYKSTLAKSVSLTTGGSYQENSTGARFPENEGTRAIAFTKQLQYQVLSKMMELSTSATYKGKPVAVLESIARKKVLATLEMRYAGADISRDDEQRFIEYINTILNLVDPHTRWTPSVKPNQPAGNLSSHYYGIGVALEEVGGRIQFKQVLPGGTANASGRIRENDELLQIGNSEAGLADVAGIYFPEIPFLIRGEKGTRIWLTVKHLDGSTETFSLLRGEIIDTESRVRSAVIHRSSGNIGFIYLPKFYNKPTGAEAIQCAKDVRNEITMLKSEGINSIIFDLRNNPGGDLGEAIAMVGLFLPPGPVAQTRNKENTHTLRSDANVTAAYEGPLAVLVNEGSASASEFFSAAMQDFGRALVIGSNTYGKGTVQVTKPVGYVDPSAPDKPAIPMGDISMTIQKFYRVNGNSTQLKGVKPDIELPSLSARRDFGERFQENALVSDRIPPVDYSPVQNLGSYEKYKNEIRAQFEKDGTIKSIREELNKMQYEQTAPWPLSWDAFSNEWQTRRSRTDKLKQLTTLPADKKLELTRAGRNDEAAMEPWLEKMARDLYLAEAVQCVEMMNGMTGK